MPSTIISSLTKFTQQEVDALFEHAQRFSSDKGLDIRLAPRTLAYGKILIMISAKSGNAPQRNVARRRIKSMFYQEKWFNQPYDWIVIIHHQAIDLPFESLKKALSWALSRAIARTGTHEHM